MGRSGRPPAAKPAPRIRLKDIAERAEVSVQAVSHILNSGRAHLFRPAMVDKVRRVADELGYRPIQSARSMRSGRFDCFALLVDTDGIRSAFPRQLFDALLREMEASGRHLIASHVDDATLADPAQAPPILRRLSADALISNYHLPMPPAMERTITSAGMPVAWINVDRTQDAVLPDERAAGRDATRWLLAAGHRRIVYVDEYYFDHLSPVRHFSKEERFAGYRDAMTGAGLAPTMFSLRDGDDLAPWLDAHPDVTAAVAAAVKPYTWRSTWTHPRVQVGGAFPVVSFGNDQAALAHVRLPTMITDWRSIAHEAVAMLDERIAGAGPLPSRRIASRLVLPPP